MVADIRQHLQAAPFEPFAIVTSSGRRYPILSANHANLNPQGTRVVVWFDDDASVTIAGLPVAAIEKANPSGGANGEPAARVTDEERGEHRGSKSDTIAALLITAQTRVRARDR